MLLDLAIKAIVGECEPLLLAVDDTRLRRSGRKVFGHAWHHDAAAKTAKGHRFARGNN